MKRNVQTSQNAGRKSSEYLVAQAPIIGPALAGRCTDTAPLPRPPRRRRRAKTERGLPDDAVLIELAKEYLLRQRKLLPTAAVAGLIPEPSAEVLRDMVADFKNRHRGEIPDAAGLKALLKTIGVMAAGAGYFRYSCDNSTPKSICDQMINCLDQAAHDGRFIPWKYVYADYSVTGLDASRQGYSSFKLVLSSPEQQIETTYIDDFSRASRDEIEWWKLAALSKRLKKRMVGASDGFDLDCPDWDMKITMYGLLSRLFIKSTRQKVGRGMRGAARRGTCLGMLSLGFTRRPKVNSSGNVVCGPDGLPIFEPCIDPATANHRLLIFQLFASENWTIIEITHHFNRERIDDWTGWTPTAIRGLLKNPTAIGVFIWNRTHREFDWEKEKWIKVKNPRKDWVVNYFKDRAIISLDLWRAAQRKLAATRNRKYGTHHVPTRNEVRPSTLFSGTLICADCQKELMLIRSAGAHQQLGCPRGLVRAHNCTLASSKSVRVIEECLLTYIRENLISDATAAEVIARANEMLVVEAAKPVVNVAPLQQHATKLSTQIKRLIDKVADADDADLSNTYHQKIKQLQVELNTVRSRIREAEPHHKIRQQPFSMEEGLEALNDLRTLLSDEVAIAGPVLRSITGPIRVRQEPIPGRTTGGRWIATISPHFGGFLARLNADQPLKLPPAPRSPIEVVIENVPNYARRATHFKKLHDDGQSINAIASAYGLTWQAVNHSIQFANTGKRPRYQSGRRTGKGGKESQYRKIASKVAQLRDNQQMSFPKIALKLNVSQGTASRAYDYAHRDEIQTAVEKNQPIQRGRYSHLSTDQFRNIVALLAEGKPTKEIAASVGCSQNTVNRERSRVAATKVAKSPSAKVHRRRHG